MSFVLTKHKIEEAMRINIAKRLSRIAYCLLLLEVSSGLIVSAGAADKSNSQKSIKLGATLALSGRLAFMGTAERDGMLLAVEEINAKGGIGGRKLELIVEDNLSEAKSAVSTVQKLIKFDSVDVLLSAFTHVTQAVKSLAAESGRVMIYQSTLREIAKESELFFRDYVDAYDSGKMLGEEVARQKMGRVSFISEINDACLDFERGVQAGLGELRFNKRMVFNPGETDFRALLLRSKGSDATVFCAWRDTALVMRQVSELGLIDLPTFHFLAVENPQFDTPELRNLYERNGMITTWHGFVKDDPTSVQKEFIDRFKLRFKEIHPAAAYAYDDIYALAMALKPCLTANGVDQTCLASELLKTDYNGVAGRLTFDQQGISTREYLLIQLKDGKWTRVQ